MTLIKGLIAVLVFGFSISSYSSSIDSIEVAEGQSLQLGYPFDIDDMSENKNECLKFDVPKFVDTEGSTNSSLRMYVVSDYDDVSNDFKYSYKATASANAGIEKIAKAKSTLETNGKLNSFFKSTDKTIRVVFEARADHGRKAISNWSLKDEYKQLLTDKKYVEFRKKCGTHYVVRAEHSSALRVSIVANNLDRQIKKVFSNELKANSSASIGIKKIKAGASSSLSSNISNTFNILSKYGTLDVKVDASGGEGIDSVSSSVSGLDVTKEDAIKGILSALAKGAKDFTQENSSPTLYYIAPFIELEEQLTYLDQDQFDRLGEIYRVLLRLDYLIEEYEGYKNEDPEVYRKYFKLEYENIYSLREDVYKSYAQCRTDKVCDHELPAKTQGYFIDDVMENAQLELDCPLDIVGSYSGRAARVVSDFYVNGVAKIRFKDEVVMDDIEVVRLRPPSQFIVDRFDNVNNLRISSTKNSDGSYNAYFTLLIASLDRSIYSEGEDLTPAKIKKINEVRGGISDTYFGLRYRTRNGRIIEDIFGKPSIRDCSLHEFELE